MAGATLVDAQAEAMKGAANNPNGAAMGFFGMNMAANAGGMRAQDFYAMGAMQQQQQQQAAAADGWKCPKCGANATGKFCPECGTPKPAPQGSWKCPQCGASVTGKFCPECGTKKPEDDGWTCPKCGASAKGKFCPECGTPKPSAAAEVVCEKCGWKAPDPANPPKFCAECGNPLKK